MTEAHAATLAPLRGRDFLTLADFTRAETAALLALARRLKAAPDRGAGLLAPKSLALLFRKSSTRTRVSFEVGMWQLGGHALFLSEADLQLSRGETVSDTARVLSRYVDGIAVRTYAHSEIEEFAAAASIPVINALTDLLHPCQALADIFTASERFGDVAGRTLAFVGDGNNVAHSLLFAGALTGMHVVVASPAGYQVEPSVLQRARSLAAQTGANLTLTEDPEGAATGADILYTDVWVSMGQEAEARSRQAALRPYQVNERLLQRARPGALIMHCLPAHRDEEVTTGLIDGPQSVIFEQVENRLHVQKAILAALLGDVRRLV